MDLNVIKEYLIGIGFKLNEDSYNQFQQTMKNAEGNIKNFANNNKDNMSSLQKFFQLFNGSLKDNMGIMAKILPETKAPFLQLIALVELLHKGVTKVSKGLKGIKTDTVKSHNVKKASETMEELSKKTKETKAPFLQLIELVKILNIEINKLSYNLQNVKTPSMPKAYPKRINPKIPIPETAEKGSLNPIGLVKTSQELENVSKKSDEAKKSLLLLKENGGKAVEDLAKTSKVSLGAMAAGLAATIAIVVSAWKTLTELAKQDLGYQKLAMQLWTTAENAREVDMALKTMKISMQDLWLSPELLRQFNQLRQDSSQLKLPADAEDKLKLVRSIVFEFKRLKQAGSLAFQWIGYYISKYAGGPLADIHQALNKFVDWILKNIPGVAKIIGSTLGIAFRLILDAVEVIGFALKPVISLIELLGKIFNDLPGPVKSFIEGLGKALVFVLAGPLLLLDDLLTALRGGKSVIGAFFDKFKEGANAIKDIKDGWNSFWGGIENFIDRIREKVRKLIKEIKDIPIVKGINDIKNLPGDIKSKVEGFVGSVKKGASTIKSYILPQSNTVNNKNSTSSQTNHNNTTNTFNIYGTTPTGTANAIDSKLNKTKTSILTRNLGGIY